MDFVGKMETPDKYTVIINMTEWCVDWPYRMGWGFYDAIQAPEQEKAPGGPNKWENATGTGPFMITDYKDGHSQIYTKNPNYWDSEVINGKKYKLPFVDKIYISIIKDEQTQIAAFRSGKLDLLMAINWKYVDELKKSLPQLKWGRILGIGNFTMAMRMDRKPFNDIRVRRAMNLAINKKEIIDNSLRRQCRNAHLSLSSLFQGCLYPAGQTPSSGQRAVHLRPGQGQKASGRGRLPQWFQFQGPNRQ